jgi:hypothetical protein
MIGLIFCRNILLLLNWLGLSLAGHLSFSLKSIKMRDFLFNQGRKLSRDLFIQSLVKEMILNARQWHRPGVSWLALDQIDPKCKINSNCGLRFDHIDSVILHIHIVGKSAAVTYHGNNQNSLSKSFEAI